VSSRLFEACEPIAPVQGQVGKPAAFMSTFINTENEYSAIVDRDYFGLEELLTFPRTKPRPSDDYYANSRLGLVVPTSTKKEKKRKYNFEVTNKSDSDFSVLQGMQVLIRWPTCSCPSIAEWKRSHCIRSYHRPTPLQIDCNHFKLPDEEPQSWIPAIVQVVHQVAVSNSVEMAPELGVDQKKRRKHTHVVQVRFPDGHEMQFMWPDSELLRFPAMEIQENVYSSSTKVLDMSVSSVRSNLVVNNESTSFSSKQIPPVVVETQNHSAIDLLLNSILSDSDNDSSSDSNEDDKEDEESIHASDLKLQQLLLDNNITISETSKEEEERDIIPSEQLPPSLQAASSLKGLCSQEMHLCSTGGMVSTEQLKQVEATFQRWEDPKRRPRIKIFNDSGSSTNGCNAFEEGK